MEASEAIANRYVIRTFLGSGSFSAVYRGIDIKKDKPVAIKVESLAYRFRSHLRHEAELMHSRLNDVHGVPHLKWRGEHNGQYTVVMSLVGQNTEDLLSLCKWKFSVKTGLMIGEQLVERLRDVHSKEVLHRDIKHDNVTIGVGKQSSTLFLIDFGLSATLSEATTAPTHFTGSLSFSSINAQRNGAQSYKDDLESLGYLLIYFVKGGLPWSQSENLDQKNIDRSVLCLKLKISDQSLGRDLPPEFSDLLTYAKGLQFGQMPDYPLLIGKFHAAGRRLRVDFDRKFDWVAIREPVNLRQAKELRKERNQSKLFQSSPKEASPTRDTPLELDPSAVMIEGEQEGVPRIVDFRTHAIEAVQPQGGKSASAKSKKPRKTIEDAEGPSMSQGLRAYINTIKS